MNVAIHFRHENPRDDDMLFVDTGKLTPLQRALVERAAQAPMGERGVTDESWEIHDAARGEAGIELPAVIEAAIEVWDD